jgi:hypothetical protein
MGRLGGSFCEFFTLYYNRLGELMKKKKAAKKSAKKAKPAKKAAKKTAKKAVKKAPKKVAKKAAKKTVKKAAAKKPAKKAAAKKVDLKKTAALATVAGLASTSIFKAEESYAEKNRGFADAKESEDGDEEIESWEEFKEDSDEDEDEDEEDASWAPSKFDEE